MKTRLLVNIGWLGLGNAIVKPLWFAFITYVCLDRIGLAQYGVMTAALALMGIAVGLSNVGTSQYTVREVARDTTLASTFLTNLLPVRTLLSVLFVFGFLVPLIVNDSADTAAFASAGGYVIALGIIEYERSFFRAFEKLRDESATVVAEKVLVIAAGTIGIVVDPSARGVLTGMFAGALAVALGTLVMMGSTYARMSVDKFDIKFIKTTLVRALPLGLAGVFVLLYFRVDSVMLKYMTDDIIVGEYGLAYRVLEALLLLPGIAVAALLPRLSFQFGGGQHDEMAATTDRSILVLFVIAVAASLVIALAAKWVIDLLSGIPTPGSESALRILVWAFPFASMAYVLSSALISMDDQKVLAVILGLSAVLNILINLVLIPRYAASGACIATVATEVLVSGMMYARYRWNVHRRRVTF